MAEQRVELPGSRRNPVPGAKVGPRIADSLRITALVVLRRKAEPRDPHHTRVLSRGELTQLYGARGDDIARVRAFAQQHNLQVVSESAQKRTVELAGTVGDMAKAFGTELRQARVGGRVYRHRVGPLTLPTSLAPAVVAVMGLDDRPQAAPRYLLRPPGIASTRTVGALTPLQVAQMYNFPPGDGSGQTIAIIELGGGFSQADLTTYFTGLGLPVPSVTAVSVMGGSNNPGVDQNADGEVMLDIEVAGAVAPAARQKIYFAPNTDAGFLAAVNAAISDVPQAVAVSISWGDAEGKWTAQAMNSFESALQDAGNLGIPVTVAAGDLGSTDGTSGLAADFPASAPHALGCGGTRLQGSGSTITSEVTWNSSPTLGATGGAISGFFPKPSYQASVSVPPPSGSQGGRGVPDVCGNAAAESPYKIRVSGQDIEVWGTSAVAPLWAGLIARFGQKVGRPVGFLNSLIYQPNVISNAFRDITSGDNDITGKHGPFPAGPGWDACTGLGSPKGSALLSALQSGPPGPPVGPPKKPPGPPVGPPKKPPGPPVGPPKKPPGPPVGPPKKPPGPPPPPAPPPPPSPSPPGTGTTGVAQAAWVPPPYPMYPTYPPLPPAPPPPAAPQALPSTLDAYVQRLLGAGLRSPTLGVVAVVGLVVVGVVAVVGLSDGGRGDPPRQ